MTEQLTINGYEQEIGAKRIVVDGYSDVAVYSLANPNVDVSQELISNGSLIIARDAADDLIVDVFGDDWFSVSVVALDVPAYTANYISAPNAVYFASYSSVTNTAVMSWDNVPGNVGYEIQRLFDDGWKTVDFVDENVTSRVARNVLQGEILQYRVRALARSGWSRWTTGKADAPVVMLAPTALAASNYDASTHSATLTWTDNSDDEFGFLVEYKVDDGDYTTLDYYVAGTTSATTTTLAPGSTYT